MNLEPKIMPAKYHPLMLSDDVPVIGFSPIDLLKRNPKQNAAIDRALAPLRFTVSNPPTEADVEAVGATLDALLANSRL